eukprot:CAMPEP_0116038018 /NCGR_PEP_ID=MMETSP0321-20121206/22485_1 /TAXON_ID=163516 /ORGANISM="Leptocylindrus danicus var. danicus, Strain B650" /LENGTH=36 /DNA_ID= /DNA_START= /DNA_END= /DNA_ORIENTATION=
MRRVNIVPVTPVMELVQTSSLVRSRDFLTSLRTGVM